VLVVAESLDWICAERLTPSLSWMARLLIKQGELELSPRELEELGQMSISTVRRLLGSLPREGLRLPRSSPSPNPIAQRVKVERIPFDVAQAGHVEMDLVHHGGRSSQGEYLHTLQMVDVASGWSERAVLVGRSYVAMEAALTQLLGQLPFPLQELHCDNGSEFLNHHLLAFLERYYPQVRLCRSRPYHKNDNRFAEQKNSSLVRAYVGYQRLDSPSQAKLLAECYALMRLYYNLYQPVLHLVAKAYGKDESGRVKVKRRYDQAATPLDRLQALGALDEHSLRQWQQLRQATSPRELRERIYQLLGKLPSLPCASALGDVRKIMAVTAIPSLPFTLQTKEAALAR